MAGDFGYGANRSGRVAFAHVVSPFAAFLLMIASLLDILQGASAVADDELYTQAKQYLYELDLTAWGWTHIVIGVLGAVVSVGILRRSGWGLVGGLAVAIVGILTNFAFLPVYPVWSGFVIAFNLVVVWALWVQLDPQPRPDLRPHPIAELKSYQDDR
ncbi:hypothetical protein GCM10023350_13510 [Nocardioides endophyticus]|uniref:DUF7144 domain-containing protein n=1 Tax=Nocardioides endophyticus TaxID=1353775 RepID=A0ABP8YIS9_9ACTN